MKSTAGHLMNAIIEQSGRALEHLLRCFACKRKQKYGLRRYAVFDQPGDTIGQRAGFSAACAGDDKQRSITMGDRFQLRRIQQFRIGDAVRSSVLISTGFIGSHMLFVS